ncbi:MAG: hypothetical protein DCE90_16720 [Pseudanabaena sp.]|nr:MAG: hypothetical protein DCE90_16720 [Pseudanabaena sp.]
MGILLIYPIIVNAPINYSSMDEIKVAWYAIAVFFMIQLVLPIILKSAGYHDPLTLGGLSYLTWSVVITSLLTIMPFVTMSGFYSAWAALKPVIYSIFVINVIILLVIFNQIRLN